MSILVFDSMFQCGNLDRVTLVNDHEYNLFINSDYNTRSTFQWFYFAVTNTKSNCKIKFNILNHKHSFSFLINGMKPVAFSELNFILKKEKWKTIESNPSYIKNEMTYFKKTTKKENDTNEIDGIQNHYYTLSFEYTFDHTNDRVYFSYYRPYSFSKMQGMLKKAISSNFKISPLKSYCLHESIRKYMSEIGNDNPEANEKPPKEKFPEICPSSQFSNSLINPFLEENSQEEIFAENQDITYYQENLCDSLCGIPIYILTITSKKFYINLVTK